MKIPHLLILVGLSLAARAHAVGCASLLGPERERLAAALAHAVDLGERTESDPRFRKLDEDIFAWAEPRLAALDGDRRENVFRILEDSRLGSRYRNARMTDEDVMEDAAGELVADEAGVRLVMDALETQSEASRFTLRHELTHILRFVVPGSLEEMSRRIEALVLDRPLGVLREEGYALREDYRYLRRNYGDADVARLLERARHVGALVEIAERRGFLVVSDERGFEVDFAAMVDREDQTLLLQIAIGEADARLLYVLKQALTLSEPRFVKVMLEKYRPWQSEADADRAAR